jgi:anhydro-N-acetylmuramic acid kinase
VIVAGVMSGTSADGIDVALVRITGKDENIEFKLVRHSHTPYPEAVRKNLLALMNSQSARVADISRMDFLLGELYADAVKAAMRKAGVKRIDLVGCHGQTVYHQGEREEFLGERVSCTWQLGEGALLAARLGTNVVSDFRPADMAAGGKGAPLVPFLDYVVYRDKRRGRILQNLGGIANLTAIPAGASQKDLIAFDTGPSNMVIDACMERLYGKRFDSGGRIAASGSVLPVALDKAMRHPYFKQRPPKTAGREEFGREFAAEFIRWCGKTRKQDVIATATALTARSIGEAIRGFVFRAAKKGSFRDYVVAGGGAKNATLMQMLRAEVEPLGLAVVSSEKFGVPAQAKEAIAFAVLAYQTWHRRPSNVPAATGAKRAAILGKISYA